MTQPFNSALETGVRTVAILTSLFPRSVDLQQLVYLDYFTLHSGDVGGPESLHAALPMRSGELTVRRGILERGLLLMMNRGLVELSPTPDGFLYRASEEANSFLSMLTSPYANRLRERARWVAAAFSGVPNTELQVIEKRLFKEWSIQFQRIEFPSTNQ